MPLRKTGSPEPLREIVGREHPRSLVGLVTQLQEGDAEQRRWAARDLASLEGGAAALGARLSVEPDDSVSDALFTALSTIGSSVAADALLPLLRADSAPLRNRAIEALACMPASAAPRVAALLTDADVDVRILAVNLLGELRLPQVLPWLLEVLAHERDVNVVAAALEVMAEVGEPQHAAAVRAAADRFPGQPFIGFAAEVAVERIESP